MILHLINIFFTSSLVELTATPTAAVAVEITPVSPVSVSSFCFHVSVAPAGIATNSQDNVSCYVDQ